jgi:hypothetical protein
MMPTTARSDRSATHSAKVNIGVDDRDGTEVIASVPLRAAVAVAIAAALAAAITASVAHVSHCSVTLHKIVKFGARTLQNDQK